MDSQAKFCVGCGAVVEHGASDEVSLLANGYYADLELQQNIVRIIRSKAWSSPIKNGKDFQIHDLSSIRFKKAGWASLGYIRFILGRDEEDTGGKFDPAKDENTVMFTSQQELEFEVIRNVIEKRTGYLKRKRS